MVEEIIDEINKSLQIYSESKMCKIIKDVSESVIEEDKKTINEIKKHIAYLKIKYDLERRESYLSRMINARKSKLWEILCDATSERLKGYGKFPKEYAQEFDSDIDKLQKLIANI